MTNSVYKLPDKDDPLQEFLSIDRPCGDCKYVRDAVITEWYAMGDLSPNARCAKLDAPVSTHVGTCEAFKRPLRGHLRLLWGKITYWTKDAYWWVKHRAVSRHKYHVINTGLTPGYYDPDTRILATIFREAIDFVDNNHWDWDTDEEHRAAWRVFKEAAMFGRRFIEGYPHGGLSDEDMDYAPVLAKKVIDNLRHMWY